MAGASGLVDVLDRVLDQSVVVAGDITVDRA
jgi:Gas vesicle protein